MQLFGSKENIAHTAITIDNAKIAENDYNLSVSSYIEAKDTREKVDIEVLNEEISQTVAKIDTLRKDAKNEPKLYEYGFLRILKLVF